MRGWRERQLAAFHPVVPAAMRHYDGLMWEQYRKSFIFTQIFILVILAVLIFFAKAGWQRAATAFVFMQVAAVIGAWWGARLKRKILAAREKLPLDRR
jgi:hypothetical protein